MRRGVIDKIDSNDSLLQTTAVHGIDGEFSTDVERYQNYGFNSFPVKIEENGHGAEVIIVDLNGSSLKTIIATDDRRYRPTQATEGDVEVYTHKDNQTANSDDALHRITLKTSDTDYSIVSKCNGTKVEQKSDGTITMVTGSSSITLLADGTININCSTLNVTGDTNFTGALTSNGKNISDSHTHGGVQSGSGSTGSVS